MPSPDRYRNILWFALAVWIGATAILSWLSYGDAAKRIIASTCPQLGWLAPPPAPIAHSAPDITGLAAEAAPPPIQRRLNAMSLDLEAVRKRIDRLLVAQEQITRDINQLMAGQEQITRDAAQLTAGQEQMTREITKLQVVEQQILQKNSERAQPPAPALAPNATPRSLLAPMMR